MTSGDPNEAFAELPADTLSLICPPASAPSWSPPSPSSSRSSSLSPYPSRSASSSASASPASTPLNSSTPTLGHPFYSSLNPNGFVQNCVSVTITRVLAYRNVDELWLNNLGYLLMDEPLTHNQLLECVARAGWECSYKVYVAHGETSAYMILEADREVKRYQVVAYQRSDGTGHCAVRERCDEGHKFVCYQRKTQGEDVSHEIQAATVLFVYCLDCKNTAILGQWRSRRASLAWDRDTDNHSSEQRDDPINLLSNITVSAGSELKGSLARKSFTMWSRPITDPVASIARAGSAAMKGSLMRQPSMMTQHGRVAMAGQYMPPRAALNRVPGEPEEDRQHYVDQLFGAPRLSAMRATRKVRGEPSPTYSRYMLNSARNEYRQPRAS